MGTVGLSREQRFHLRELLDMTDSILCDFIKNWLQLFFLFLRQIRHNILYEYVLRRLGDGGRGVGLGRHGFGGEGHGDTTHQQDGEG